jgi:hypothetical protein
MADSRNGKGSDGELAAHERVSISSVAAFLDTLTTRGLAPRKGPLHIPVLGSFDSSQVPQISMYDYLERLRAFAKSETSIVVALIYIDRILAADPNFTVTDINVHRMLLTCMTVAEKYSNDIPYVNSHYAMTGGVGLQELNVLEKMLFYVLKWRLSVSPEEYDKKQEEVRRAFVEVLCASEATEWIVLNEATCETTSEVACKKASKESWYSPSACSMQASTISGSESISSLSESTDSSSEVASVVAD